MAVGLPLQVLGLISPILCWVEGGESFGLPGSQSGKAYFFEDRVRNWLKWELPTYSYDNLDEIVELALDDRKRDEYPRKPHQQKRQSSIMAPPDMFDLIYIFKKLSHHYFKWTGNKLCIREERMVELHELALRFPVRHLVHFCHAEAVVKGYINMDRALELPGKMKQLHTTYQGLCTVVNRGLSEGHLHLNGVIDADDGWADHMLRRISPGRLGLNPEARRLLELSRTALQFLALGMLYALLEKGNDHNLPFHLIQYLDKIYLSASPLEDINTMHRFKKEYIDEFMDEKKLGKISWKQHPKLLWLLSLAKPGLGHLCFINDITLCEDELIESRVVSRRLQLLNRLHLTVQEFLFKHYALTNPENYEPGNALTAARAGDTGQGYDYQPVQFFINQVFTRYVIYHTHHWQNATQSGKTTGLRFFKGFFDAPQRSLLTKNTVEIQGQAFQQLGEAKPLRQVEGRLCPPKRGAANFMPWLLAFAQHAKNDDLEKFGIVVHFRREDYKPSVRTRTHRRLLKLRSDKIRRLTKANAFRLFRLLSRPHQVIPFIVGIDAANLELTTPPEVFAPAFRFLREYPIQLQAPSISRQIIEKTKDIADLVTNRRLGLTYHVGEDFRHLLSGLRAVHEVIEFLKPLPGDRLGHAIALGLSPETWAEQVGYQAVMPEQEWLDTLVWVHNFMGAGNDLVGELGLEDLIQIHGRHIYGHSELLGKKDLEQYFIPTTLHDSWLLRQLDPYSLENGHIIDLKALANNKFHSRNPGQGIEHKRWNDVQKKVLKEVHEKVGTDAAYLFTKLYWYCPGVWKNGMKTIPFDMMKDKEKWIRLCHEVQEKMKALVRQQQLVVEVNPSSNRVVGHMATMSDHHVFRLTLDESYGLSRVSRVTINTDDPGVFSTSLSHEFFLLGEILLKKGVPEPKVVEWLEWLRGNGKDYSFLRDLPPAKDRRVKKILDSMVKRYSPLLQRVSGKRRRYKPPEMRDKPDPHSPDEVEQLKARYHQMEYRYKEMEKRMKTLERLVPHQDWEKE